MSELNLSNLQINKGSHKKGKRVGRGNASGRGTYSGRGLKGQKARSGGKSGLRRRALKLLLRSKPKLGGFKSLNKKMTPVNVEVLERYFNNGELVNAKKLIAKKLIEHADGGLKILGNGKINKKLNVTADGFSESAQKAILDAGGQVNLLVPVRNNSKKAAK